MYGGSPKKRSARKAKKVAGSIVTFKNGAKARVQPNGQYRIISGASPEYMRQIGRKKGSKANYAAISLKSAKRAFNSHYKKRKGTPRGNKMART